MRFLADENVSRVIVDKLRAEGFDLTSVAATFSGASDEDVLAYARDEERALITGDHDFGEMVIRRKLAVRSVVLLELDRLPSAAAADLVAQFLRRNPDKLQGHLVVIEPARFRIRPLSR